jgi:N-acetylmuramoyl-L-alanine amidase
MPRRRHAGRRSGARLALAARPHAALVALLVAGAWVAWNGLGMRVATWGLASLSSGSRARGGRVAQRPASASGTSNAPHATRAPRPPPSPPPVGTTWPDPPARLSAPLVALGPDGLVRRIYLDAGHGAPDNPGNTSCFCVKEQDFTRRVAREVKARLEATGRFVVWPSREGEELVPYRERVEAATRLGADAFVSLHSDVRLRAESWSPAPAVSCPVRYGSTGFSVLYSDEGEDAIVALRRELAREVAFQLGEVRLPPYDGAEYASLYEADPLGPGVFVDRHTPRQRIFVLYRPPMPAILVETHHALDPREARRWEETETLDAFAAALTAALSAVLPARR